MMQTTLKPEGEVGWKERIPRYAFGFAVLFVVYLVPILVYIYPHWPLDSVGWAILILVGFPVSACLELIGGFIFSRQAGQRISAKRFSATRIGIALLVFMGLAGGLLFLWSSFEPFIRPHFK